MRQLTYDCYSGKGIKEKTVLSLALANEWKNNNKNNYVKEKLINISEEEAFNDKATEEKKEQLNKLLTKRFIYIGQRAKKNNY